MLGFSSILFYLSKHPTFFLLTSPLPYPNLSQDPMRILLILFILLIPTPVDAPVHPTLALEPYLSQEAQAYSVPPALAAAIITKESNWKPHAARWEPRLNQASIGLFQILPTTAKACPGSPTATALLDPKANIRCGLYLLSFYLRKYRSPHHALIAFNGGEGCLTMRCSGAEAYANAVLISISKP